MNERRHLLAVAAEGLAAKIGPLLKQGILNRGEFPIAPRWEHKFRIPKP
jgi:hypothetical protein